MKHANMAYIGPPGTSLGYKLAGLQSIELDETAQLLPELKKLKETDKYSIIFVDELLAQGGLPDIARLNENPIPAIVLLPNTADPQNVTQDMMNNLITKAVGSDIFS